MALARGFAAQADRLSLAVRSELGLATDDRLDAVFLATEYGVPVIPITDLVAAGASAASVHQLTVADPGCFSAGTVLASTGRMIVFNPVHADGRLANSLTHELAHLLLEHAPGPAIGPGGCRVWDQQLEQEADLLAGMLLVCRDAALACARAGLPHDVGAARFGVSEQLMRWRTNQSGAARQASAAARQRGRRVPRLSAADVRTFLSASDLRWLQDLTAAQWRMVLSRCRDALVNGSVPELIEACRERGL